VTPAAVSQAGPARPTVAFRVGVTGARSLRAARRSAIQGQLIDVLRFIRDEVQRLSSLPEVKHIYLASGPDGPALRLLSPLARGADRLAARAAIDLGFTLCVPMPFPRAQYEEDFTGEPAANGEELPLTPEDDLGEFRKLLADASEQVELDGDKHLPADSLILPEEGYQAVGRFVARHSDLLLAVWDGSHSNGIGGTAEIVHYAATAGIPVWWIHATKDQKAVWIDDIQDLRDPRPGMEGTIPPKDKLQRYLTRAILPLGPIRRTRHDSMARISSIFRPKDDAPLEVYFAERARPRWFIWNAYSWLMTWAARLRPPWTESHRPSILIGQFWFDLYQPTDHLANYYAARYRSSYVWTIFLTTMALIFGAGAGTVSAAHLHVTLKLPLVIALFELLTLVLILVLVVAALRFEWHQKSIEYRLLAELYRKQQTLASIGWSLPLGKMRHFADTERVAWISWLFAAMERAMPIAATSPADNQLKQEIVHNFIKEQARYHKIREKRSHNALETFESFGTLAFFAVLACVVLKIVLELFVEAEGPVLLIGLLATVLPGVSAAFVALRSYAELQLLAEQSHYMHAELERAQSRVGRLNMNRVLASQDLGAEAAAVAALMLQDLEGWGRLFRGKLPEAS
jgi:hypothetical protein